MGERVGYEDWDKIVKAKEESLKAIEVNAKNLKVGRIVEELVLRRALEERAKYQEPVVEEPTAEISDKASEES